MLSPRPIASGTDQRLSFPLFSTRGPRPQSGQATYPASPSNWSATVLRQFRHSTVLNTGIIGPTGGAPLSSTGGGDGGGGTGLSVPTAGSSFTGSAGRGVVFAPSRSLTSILESSDSRFSIRMRPRCGKSFKMSPTLVISPTFSPDTSSTTVSLKKARSFAAF